MARMCLYNDNKLPEMPKEWDVETHPHAYIWIHSDGGAVLVVIDARMKTYYRSDGIPKGCHTGDTDESGTITTKNFIQWNCDAGGAEWWLEGEHHVQDLWVNYDPVWANTDILNSDGSVALAASEPVLIQSFQLFSWLVGFLAFMVGKMFPGASEVDVYGVVDDVNDIAVIGDLGPGTYSLKYVNQDGTTTDIDTFMI